MAEARAKDEWSRMSALMALLANCHRDPKRSRPFTPKSFDPFAPKPKPFFENIGELRAWFCGPPKETKS